MKDIMRKSLEEIGKQFEYKPEIADVVGHLAKFEKVALFGMGGSGLLADTLLYLKPEMDVVVHKDYGLPEGKDLSGRLLIFVSYSGNTEEVLDSFDAALEAGHHMAVITTGGKLLKKAKDVGVLYVQIPDTKIQPRTALPLMLLGAAKLMQDDELIDHLKDVGKKLDPGKIENDGKKLAEKLKDKVPLIYGSQINAPLSYIWKINFNETAKIPAFYNVVPESNHNELNGFDVREPNQHLSEDLATIFLEDKDDHPRIQKRMEVMQKLHQDKGVQVETVSLRGKSKAEKFFYSALFAGWVTYHVAAFYGSDVNTVPIIEDFKKKIG